MKNYLKLIFFGEVWWYGWGITLLIALMISWIVLNANSRNPEPVLLTATPQPSATFTPAPTETPAPTPPMPTPDETIASIPPLNEMCWTQNALASFYEQEFGLDIEWTEIDQAKFKQSFLLEYDEYTVIQLGVDIEKDCEACCITNFSLTTITHKEYGDWKLVGGLHGMIGLMADGEYLALVQEVFDECTETGERSHATAFTFNGYYSAREVDCRPAGDLLQLTSHIWNDTQDWIDANPDATITTEDGNLHIEVCVGECSTPTPTPMEGETNG